MNPTGFTNLKIILQQIYLQGIVNSNGRKCVTITCDGVPYTHASDIQDEWKICSVCHDLIGKGEERSHTVSHEEENIEFKRPFPELLLLPGPGHIEMNMGKKLLSFL